MEVSHCGVPGMDYQEATFDPASSLPSFSHVWANQQLSPDQQQQLFAAQIAHVNQQLVYRTDSQQQQHLTTGGGVNEDECATNGSLYEYDILLLWFKNSSYVYNTIQLIKLYCTIWLITKINHPFYKFTKTILVR